MIASCASDPRTSTTGRCRSIPNATSPSSRATPTAERKSPSFAIASLPRCSAAEIAAAVEENQSLIKGIEALNRQGGLRSMLDPEEPGPREPLPGTAILDPKDPIAPADLWSRIAATLGRWRQPTRRGTGGERADPPAAGAERRDEARLEEPRNGAQSQH